MKIKEYKEQFPGLYYFDNFTFTTLGTSGSRGPDVSKTYANAPWREGDFYIQDGQQYWTVPANGTYQIEAAGAYGATPGRVVTGQVKLNEGQTLTMLVGQCPNPLVSNVQDNVTVGGGGGTFVVSGDTPLIVASGGDGSTYFDNPWSQAVVLPTYLTYEGFCTSLSSDGLTLVSLDPFGDITIYKYDGYTWQLKKTLLGLVYGFGVNPGIYGVRVDDTGSKFATSSEVNVVRIYETTTWSYETINDPDFSTPGVYITDFMFSGDGQTVVFGLINNKIKVYNGTTLIATIISSGLQFVSQLNNYNPISYSGHRFAITEAGNLSIYDYPWTNPPSVITTSYRPYAMSGAGDRLLGNNGVYSYPWSNTQDIVIANASVMSKDGLTIVAGGVSQLLIYEYPWTSSQQILPSPTNSPFWGFTVNINDNGSVLSVSDILNSWIGVYYKTNQPQPGNFLPSGSGLGDSGAGYEGDGEQSNPYFGFMKPKAYIYGGFGNAYQYGIHGEGGFGGGQSPLNQSTQITSIVSSVQPTTLETYAYIQCLNNDGTIWFLNGLGLSNVYSFNGTSWDLVRSVYDGNQLVAYTIASISDDGSKIVYTVGQDTYRDKLCQVRLFQTSIETIATDQYAAKISGDGNWIVYSGPSGTYKYNISTTIVTKVLDVIGKIVDISHDGSNIVVGTIGAVHFYPSLKKLEFNTSEILSVGLSGDGNVLFTGFESALYVYKNEILIDNVSDSPGDFYWYVDYYGSKAIGASSGYVYNNTLTKLQTIINNITAQPFFQSHALSSDGIHVCCKKSGTSTNNVYTFSNTTVTTLTSHAYPHNYKILISYTDFFDGTWEIVTTSSITFTFQAFGGPTETSGYVSGTTIGISGGGGYTGSPGDGVSGATCYADESVSDFTDLGPKSNTSGYVTVSLIDPKPLTESWSWDDESPWETVNSFQSNAYTLTWCESLGIFLIAGFSTTPCISISSDGKNWSTTSSFFYSYADNFSCASEKIVVFGHKTSTNGIEWIDNNIPIDRYRAIDTSYLNNRFLSHDLDSGQSYMNLYTSYDGFTWELVTDNFPYGKLKVYYNDFYIGIHKPIYSPYFTSGNLMYSNDLINWTITDISNVIDITIIDNNTCIAVGNGFSYISTNGTQWSPNIAPFSGSIQRLVYGNNTLIVLDTVSSHVNLYSSVDGIQWTYLNSLQINEYYDDYFINITFSPSLGYFLIIPGQNKLPLITLEGKYIVPYGSQFRSIPTDCAWSSQLGMFVVITRGGYIYTSLDEGHTWTEKLLYNSSVDLYYPYVWYTYVLWIDNLGKFFAYVMDVNYPTYTIKIFTSIDGINWIFENDYVPSNNSIYYASFAGKPFWSLEHAVFINKNGYSRDGITWIDQNNDNILAYSPELSIYVGTESYSTDGFRWISSGLSFSSSAWSPTLKLFVAIQANQYVVIETYFYSSKDGKSWTNDFVGFHVSQFSGVVWSSELNKFFVLISGYPPDRIMYESIDGHTWTEVQINNINGGYIQYLFWNSGLHRMVFTNSQSNSICFSSKAIKQF